MQLRALAFTGLLLGSVSPAGAQFVASEESLEGLYKGKAYSPYAQTGFPTQVFWGDTHLHTGLSMDAGLFGNGTGLDTAFKFARGEEVVSATGQPAKLARPLDWLVTTEHSDGMGMSFDLFDGTPNILASEQGARWSAAMNEGGEASAMAAIELIQNFIRPGRRNTETSGRTSSTRWRAITNRAALPLSSDLNGPRSLTATTCTAT